MLNRKHLSLTFSGLCLFSAISVAITFIVWNRPEKLQYGENDVIWSEVKGNVEKCHLGQSSVYVKGWIYPTTKYEGMYKGNTYVVLNDGGTLYKIKTVRENRPDVTSYFKAEKKKFDLTGYSSASRFSIFGLSPSNEIYVITENDGTIRGMKHVCS
ncbi:hypothetical protein ACMGLT_19845 [Enterobacter hormaechei]|uniref:hypothetical protein n=1 Tax=Enterobacter cloacae complex TaxID=354276 RepID=UPI000F819DAC|nr:hypothetical protein [Enterobacter hormaechei]EJK8586396.1 hypothetical protein [Enterobacter hormaechei]EKK5518789.1 hypothetical protein [Enterobacter hormaechei]EKS6306092.1 hypothetical protein [Enterobacter hormaechei]EKT9840035.1 hypothetical protein [Enterobacter hormaechei]EKX4902015.1 hypothetical protein [Enterobacter hormaechei]